MLATRQGKLRNLFQGGAATSLLPPKPRKPDLVLPHGFKQRLHFAQPAAAVRSDLVQQAMLGLLLGDSLLRQQIGQVQLPLQRNAIAIGIRLGKVVAGIEEQHRNAGTQLHRQLQQQHILGLKAACQANIIGMRCSCQLPLQKVADMSELGVKFERKSAHRSPFRVCKTPVPRSHASALSSALSEPSPSNRADDLPSANRAPSTSSRSSSVITNAPACVSAAITAGVVESARTTTAPRSKSTRSNASANDAGPVSSMCAPLCPQRAARSSTLTGSSAEVALEPSTSRIIPAATVAFVS